jgi:hypothetical protein
LPAGGPESGPWGAFADLRFRLRVEGFLLFSSDCHSPASVRPPDNRRLRGGLDLARSGAVSINLILLRAWLNIYAYSADRFTV